MAGERGRNFPAGVPPRLAGFVLFVAASAALLDGHLPGGSLLLGSMGLLPLLLWANLPLGSAAPGIFLLGLLLDGTHLSLPLGFNAFFGLGSVFFLQFLGRHLLLGRPRRSLALVAFSTAAYFTALSAAAAPAPLPAALLALLLSCLFNGLLWLLPVRWLFAVPAEKSIEKFLRPFENPRRWRRWRSN